MISCFITAYINHLLLVVNSSTNFIVYTFLSKRFRKELVEITKSIKNVFCANDICFAINLFSSTLCNCIASQCRVQRKFIHYIFQHFLNCLRPEISLEFSFSFQGALKFWITRLTYFTLIDIFPTLNNLDW